MQMRAHLLREFFVVVVRTEQILAIPFSDTESDLATLDLNNRINPTMAW